MSAQTLCGGMPSLTQIAEVFGTQPVGTTRDLGSLGEYLSVGLLDESGCTLETHDLDSGRCTRGDVWWRIEGEYLRVQVRVSDTAGRWSPGVYGRKSPVHPVFATLMVVLAEPVVSRTRLERLLAELVPLLSGVGNPPKMTPEFTYLGTL
jgi:hypothetical protein